jgi:hypothetical protein
MVTCGKCAPKINDICFLCRKVVSQTIKVYSV